MCLAIPGQVLSTEGEALQRMGRVQYGDIVKEASLAFVPEAVVGDYVLVHAGIALKVVDEEEARKTFAYLDEIGEVQDSIREA